MTSIPLIVKTSECKQFRCFYLKNKKIFSGAFSAFFESAFYRTFSKKDDPHSLCISEITDHERRA